MSAEQVQDLLFLFAGFGGFLHIVCTAGLRASVREDAALRGVLFSSPLARDWTRTPWLLRGKYFVPWTSPPDGLKASRALPRILFWGARLGAMLVALGFAFFFVAVFWQVGHS